MASTDEKWINSDIVHDVTADKHKMLGLRSPLSLSPTKTEVFPQREPTTPTKTAPDYLVEAPRTGSSKRRRQQPLAFENDEGQPKVQLSSSSLFLNTGVDALSKISSKASNKKLKKAIAKKPQRKSQRKAKDVKSDPAQTDIRSHFRSARLSARAARKKKQTPEEMIRNKEEPNLKIVEIPGKGKGVINEVPFMEGEYVCEYSGDLITEAEAHEREKLYALEDLQRGNLVPMCYMYFLKHDKKSWCVDATKSGRIGRLINHSRFHPNLQTKLFVVDDVPHLGLVATKDIPAGTELLYDYGERDKQTIAAYPWLNT